MAFRCKSSRSRCGLATGVVLCLAACTGGFRSDQPPAQAYVLRVAPTRAEALPQRVSLQVARPLPHPGLESDRIVVLRSDRRLDHLASSRWAADVPELIEALAVDTLRRGGAFSAVHDSFGGFAPDYVLRITIRRFDADYTTGNGAPRVLVALDCVLGRRGGSEVLASFSAEGTMDAEANRVGSLVAAFEAAAATALESMANGIYAALRAAKAEG